MAWGGHGMADRGTRRSQAAPLASFAAMNWQQVQVKGAGVVELHTHG
jgi:hypothetical protein